MGINYVITIYAIIDGKWIDDTYFCNSESKAMAKREAKTNFIKKYANGITYLKMESRKV